MMKFLLSVLLLGLTTHVLATPTEEVLNKITKQVVKVQVALSNGNDGTGSGVVIAKDRIVTNCHVVAHAKSIHVLVGEQSYKASSITPDWYHDICLLKVEGLNAPIATIGKSKNLEYQQSVVAIGYPNTAKDSVSSHGHIRGLMAMDGSVVIRATSTFKRGESGGGLFDDHGHLVGVITLKSPGKHVYYYNMPVEWVQALVDQPEQAINADAEPAFWATKADQWPFFMKVVKPYVTKDWTSLMTVASKWIEEEPENIEAWFYLAAAEYAKNDMANAEVHMKKVISMNARHSQASYYIGLIAEESAKQLEAKTHVALLSKLDSETATKRQTAISFHN